jgi:hypothetical protein
MSKNDDLIEKSFQLMENTGKQLREAFVVDNEQLKTNTQGTMSYLLNPANRWEVTKYGVILSTIIMFSVFYHFNSNDRSASTSNFYSYLFMGSVFLILSVLSIYATGKQRGKNILQSTFIMIIIGLIIGMVVFFYSTLNAEQVSTMSYVMFGLLFLGLVTALAIIFYFFSNALKRTEGVPGLIVNIIFYLPCLMIDFVNYIRKEFDDTTHTVYYLFVIEILIVLGYLYIPTLINKLLFRNGIKLLPDSLFLDNEHIIAGSENVKKISPSVFNVSDPEYRKNYSLSMWIYLNDQPTNYNGYAKETNIFNYADGAPKITYQYEDKEDEEENEKMNVYFTNNNELSSNLNLKMSVRVKKQKWNHIVVNYNNNFADLFVNGRLENSVSLASHTPVYSPSDTIKIGAADGLDGALANVTYYPNVMTKTQIANEYTLLRNKKPPVELF